MDPDGHGVTYSIEGETRGVTVSISGTLTWDADANQNEVMTLLLTDECGATSRWKLHFKVKAVWGGGSSMVDNDLFLREQTFLALMERKLPRYGVQGHIK